MKRVISYSLWGSLPMYTVGAVRNADLALQLFPEWTCRFYCFESVPELAVRELRRRSNTEVVGMPGPGDGRGMFARFLAAVDPGVEYMLSRDTDSRLSRRERLAVEAWLAEGTDLHLMRDHPHHGLRVLGGMWGARRGVLKGLEQAIAAFAPTPAKGQDQVFLISWLGAKLDRGELTCTEHDPLFSRLPFPHGAERGGKNGGVWFVGQVFDEHDRCSSLGLLLALPLALRLRLAAWLRRGFFRGAGSRLIQVGPSRPDALKARTGALLLVAGTGLLFSLRAMAVFVAALPAHAALPGLGRYGAAAADVFSWRPWLEVSWPHLVPMTVSVLVLGPTILARVRRARAAPPGAEDLPATSLVLAVAAVLLTLAYFGVLIAQYLGW